MKTAFKIFIITFIAVFAGQYLYDKNKADINKYIKTQIRQAKYLCLVLKYNLKPQGLEG